MGTMERRIIDTNTLMSFVLQKPRFGTKTSAFILLLPGNRFMSMSVCYRLYGMNVLSLLIIPSSDLRCTSVQSLVS
jgi:hypothetical protein